MWRPGSDTTPQIPERFGSALRAGGRYVRYAPVVRRILFRAALFLVPGERAVGAPPLVASHRLGELEFIRAMGRVRESRLRTGATQWGLFRDGEQPRVFQEIFVVASWEEHLRQHRERMTATDRGYEEQAKVLSDTPSQTWHLLPTDPGRQ